MWLLPWEKLPPLILGPLMLAVGVFVFLVPEQPNPDKHREALLWGVAYVVAGVAVTGYGIWKQCKSRTD
ncbi:hypothetical protein HPT27_15815 [Permianibacter sp. IMCC34836]|uniref:hypothetical protein n=1 Tax=Permianibacter fluminis TaxID=2738515 RepID=UPI001557D0D4|nr:hypothetical protein [Permianibacter fluminis]NQD38489.1 hypothetical protein [Permianibacter fluminis]